ncbi:MAG: hypothetical protein JWR19_103 [Pedosphaera sp.]|nr:hypothetical protein [Pedosphaera sp.]
MLNQTRAFSRGRFQRKPLLSSLFLGLFFLVLVLSGSESLHRIFHKDAGHPNHSCVVSLFVKGLINSAEPCLFFAVALRFITRSVPVLESFIASAADYRISSSRAPPLFS